MFHAAGENLLILCLDLFLAGSKTTTDTLATTFLFLSLNPEWLRVLQAELDSVVGRSRAPTEDDLPSLPITEAFLAEVIQGRDRDINYRRLIIRYKHVATKYITH